MFIQLNRTSEVPLTRQIYTAIKNGILRGDLHANQKIPSSRELANDLQVSRTIVVDAYEQLLAEGYTYAKEGSGTFVSEGVLLNIPLTDSQSVETRSEFLYQDHDETLSFRTGVPDLGKVPLSLWARLYRRTISSLDAGRLDYSHPMGDVGLRTEIANYLRRIRGVVATPEQILITNGAAQGFSLLKSFVKHDEYILVENPISKGIIETLQVNNVRYQSINVDKMGMDTANLPQEPPKCILTTPSHQFPTGVVMHIKRRVELIKYAEKHNVFIIEDDYDSEYRYQGEPIQALQSLDPSRVIYIGSFSKTFCPAIRLGYMILPKVLVDSTQYAKYGSDIHSPLLNQITMAAFIREGDFEKHIRRMKKVYCRKRDILIAALQSWFGEDVVISGADSGLHLVAYFREVTFDGPVMEALKENGVFVHSLAEYDIAERQNTSPGENAACHSLVMGFGNMNESEISRGVEIIHRVVVADAQSSG